MSEDEEHDSLCWAITIAHAPWVMLPCLTLCAVGGRKRRSTPMIKSVSVGACLEAVDLIFILGVKWCLGYENGRLMSSVAIVL